MGGSSLFIVTVGGANNQVTASVRVKERICPVLVKVKVDNVWKQVIRIVVKEGAPKPIPSNPVCFAWQS